MHLPESPGKLPPGLHYSRPKNSPAHCHASARITWKIATRATAARKTAWLTAMHLPESPGKLPPGLQPPGKQPGSLPCICLNHMENCHPDYSRPENSPAHCHASARITWKIATRTTAARKIICDPLCENESDVGNFKN